MVNFFTGLKGMLFCLQGGLALGALLVVGDVVLLTRRVVGGGCKGFSPVQVEDKNKNKNHIVVVTVNEEGSQTNSLHRRRIHIIIITTLDPYSAV